MNAVDRWDQYPEEADVGCTARWELPLEGRGALVWDGTLLGAATTRQYNHSHAGKFVQDERKCPACRWFETWIFRETKAPDRRCLIYRIGMSNVPGEVDRIRDKVAKDPYEAVFLLSGVSREDNSRFLSYVVRRALDQAAEYDPDFRRALADWDSEARAS